MNYTENLEGIRMDIQAVHITLSDNLQQSIRKMILRLRRHFYELNWVDVYFRKKSKHSAANRKVSIRLGIPGNDVFASDSGNNWLALIKSVEGKLRRQLEKRLNS
jgi:putative sigma-54 modulation protein